MGWASRPEDFINTTNRPNAVSKLQESVAAGEAAPQSIPFPEAVFETIMTGDILQAVVATQDEYGFWQIQFDLTSDSSGDFFDYTRDNIGEVLAIILDGRVLSTPVINAAINDNGVISGNFSQDEAESLAIQMRYGALPIPLQVVDVRTIGASLGQDSIDRSLQAGIVGGALILIFMVLLYRLPGVLADISLGIYVTFNLAMYKLLPVTLTLPGIAGFILSIGMAVDANILVFERMKEELRSGRSLRLAVETGFSRAWPAIPRRQPLNADLLRRAVLVRQQLRRQHREGLCYYACNRRPFVYVHGCFRHAHLNAWLSLNPGAETPAKSRAAGILKSNGDRARLRNTNYATRKSLLCIAWLNVEVYGFWFPCLPSCRASSLCSGI